MGNGQIERYGRARYFTVTGRVFRGAPLEIEDHSEDIRMLHERLVLTKLKGKWPLQPLQGGRIPYGHQRNTLVSIAANRSP